MKISVVDFFCGCGGMSAGLKAAGMDILAGIDHDQYALKTYERNFPEAHIIPDDISELTCEDLKHQLGDIPRPILFTACAPCQPFSRQNRYKDQADDRVILLDEFHKFIQYFQPEYVLLENVPGLQKILEGPFVRFTNLLDKLGYKLDYGVKNAQDYGVAQSRRRLVLIASKAASVSLPEHSHGDADDLVDYVTVGDVINNYPAIAAGETHPSIANHQAARISEKNMIRLRQTPEGGDRRNWSDDLLLTCHRNKTGYTDTYGRLKNSKPAKTLTTKCISISNGRFGHPTQDRALTVREAAALQSFSDDFIFEGGLVQTAKQVGNAVPVKFAQALGLHILDHHQDAMRRALG